MLKKLLLGLALVAFVGTAGAQRMQIHRNARLNTKSSELKLKTRNVDSKVLSLGSIAGTASLAAPKAPTSSMLKAPAATTWFQYSFVANGKVGIIGWSDFTYLASENTTDYNIAVLIPERFAKAVIDSVTNVFNDVDGITDCKLWISNVKTDEEGYISIPLKAENADYSQNVSSSEIKGKTSQGYLQSSDIALSQKFTVESDGCLIGFEFKAAEGARPIVYGGTGVSGGWFMKYIYEEETYFDSFSSIGNLAIGAHMDVTECTSNSVTVNGVLESTFKAGEESYMPVSVTNNAYKTVESVSYVVTVNRTKGTEQEMTLNKNYQISGGSSDYIYVPTTVKEGENLVSVEVTKVNGESNVSTNPSGSGYILGVETPAERVSVVEEATSTECGYCPRGTVGMEKVKEALGNKVITLSVHGKQNQYEDPMTCSDYAKYLAYFGSSFPDAYINRAENADPYAGFYDNYDTDSAGYPTKVKFGLDKAVTAVDKYYPTEGSITLTAQLSEAEKKITVDTKTTFNIDRETAPYSLVFVLTEDGMTGKDSGKTLWSQYNYYSQDFIDAYYQYYGEDISTLFTDTDMDRYKNGAYKYAETYNNVVVQAWGGTTTYGGKEYDMCPLYGIAAFETQSDIVKEEAKDYSTTLDISNNTLIQSYRNLYLAVLLINDNNLQIVNAAQVKLIDPTGINSAVKDNANSNVVARYSIDGRKLDAPVKGLNIVKMADGSSKKVLVK